MLSKTLKLKKNLDKRKMTKRGHRILHFVEIYYPTDFHAKWHQRKLHISASRIDNPILEKVPESTFRLILWDTKEMSIYSKLWLYCSIERNFKVGEACIFWFWGFGVVMPILIKFLNLLSQNPGVGLELKIFWSRLRIHKMTKL